MFEIYLVLCVWEDPLLHTLWNPAQEPERSYTAVYTIIVVHEKTQLITSLHITGKDYLNKNEEKNSQFLLPLGVELSIARILLPS